MTTEDLIEQFLDEGEKAFKKHRKTSARARKLDRHETITIDGVEFCCWREFTCYKMGEYIKEVLPNSFVKVTLDKNDSYIQVELNDNEAGKLNQAMFSVLKKANKIVW